MAMCALVLAVALSLQKEGVDFRIASETEAIDPARSVFVAVTATAPQDVEVRLPDLGGRLRGFSSAESFAEPTVTAKDGSVTQTTRWKLVPEPCADVYRISPVAVGVTRRGADVSFVAGPLYFGPPAARPAVEGGIEIDPQKDLPPWSWKRVLKVAGWALLAVLLAGLVWLLIRLLVRRVKEYRLSPVERALAELDRLLAKALPTQGRYKDFYVELTLVVRRYVQRAYGVRAPHLTTEEFLREVSSGAGSSGVARCAALKDFLETSDRVKFAGLQATPELAGEASDRARRYLVEDSRS